MLHRLVESCTTLEFVRPISIRYACTLKTRPNTMPSCRWFFLSCITFAIASACFTNKCMNTYEQEFNQLGHGDIDFILDVPVGREDTYPNGVSASTSLSLVGAPDNLFIKLFGTYMNTPTFQIAFQCDSCNMLLYEAVTYGCGCSPSGLAEPSTENGNSISWSFGSGNLQLDNEAVFVLRVHGYRIMIRFILRPCLLDSRGRPSARPTIVQDLDRCAPIVRYPQSELLPIVSTTSYISGPHPHLAAVTKSRTSSAFIQRPVEGALAVIDIEYRTSDNEILLDVDIDRLSPRALGFLYRIFYVHIAVYDCNCTLINECTITSAAGIPIPDDFEKRLSVRFGQQPAYAVIDWNSTADPSLFLTGNVTGSRKVLFCTGGNATCDTLNASPPTTKILPSSPTCPDVDCFSCPYPPYEPCPAPCGSTAVQTRTREPCKSTCQATDETRTCHGVCILPVAPIVTGGDNSTFPFIVWISVIVVVVACCLPCAIQCITTAVSAAR